MQPLQNSSQRGGENQREKPSSLLAIKLKFRRKRKKEGGKKEGKNERKKGRRGENFSTSLRAPPFPCGNRGKRVKFECPEMRTVTARRDPHWIQRRLALRLETTILKIEYLFNNYPKLSISKIAEFNVCFDTQYSNTQCLVYY